MSGLLFTGDLYIDRLTDAGAKAGFLGKLNGVKLTITHPEPDKRERISKMRDSFGQALDTVNLPKPPELEISVDSQLPEILAMALLGRVDSLTQGSGTVTDQAVTLIPGKWVQLGHRNIGDSGFGVATAAVPGTPLVLGEDYEVDYAGGMIRAIVGGDITAETACLVDYTYAAITGKRIQGGARPTLRCAILLDGTNLATGESGRLEIDNATLSPANGVDLLSGEFVVTELKGTMSIQSGQDAPYRFDLYTAS